FVYPYRRADQAAERCVRRGGLEPNGEPGVCRSFGSGPALEGRLCGGGRGLCAGFRADRGPCFHLTGFGSHQGDVAPARWSERYASLPSATPIHQRGDERELAGELGQGAFHVSFEHAIPAVAAAQVGRIAPGSELSRDRLLQGLAVGKIDRASFTRSEEVAL